MKSQAACGILLALLLALFLLLPVAPGALAADKTPRAPAAEASPGGETPAGMAVRAARHWTLEIEGGPVFTGMNDVQIPNNENGTRFSFVDDLESETEFAYRVRLSYALSRRTTLSGLYAPLAIDASGRLDREATFEGVTFPAATVLTGRYRFNSYRLTYRYDDAISDKFVFGYGFTAKIRDAFIDLKGDGRSSRKDNVGLVPLLHFRLLWLFANPLSLRLEGDALAAPQGRAEDVLLALQYEAAGGLNMAAGYRVLEGGADVEEVYTFALLHYLVASLSARF
jgi:hypothetical protein